MSQQEYEDTTKSKTRSRSPSPLKTSHNEILSLEKEVKDKEHELSIAYQTSLELIETNNELQQQFEEQCIMIQTLDANIVDYEMKIDLVEAENMEYQQTFLQTNEKYEQLLGELAVTREHLNNSKDEINEYQHTIQLLNHDIIHNTNDKKQVINHHNNNNEVREMREKLSKQQRKYDELLRDCERYRIEYQHLEDAQIEIENMKNSQIKYEKRAKLLSDQIVELTYQNVQLEKEINDYNSDINQQNQTIQYLQTENQKLMTQKLINNHNMNGINNTQRDPEPNKLAIGAKKRLYSSYGGPESVLSTFVNTAANNNISENNDLKRRLSVQLRDNFGYNSKLVMFANNIDENQASDPNPNPNANEDCNDSVEEENDLFTMVQSYENNDEYLRNAEMEESLSDLSEKNTTNTQIVHEEKKSADSVSPKSNDPVLANKSRQEKAIDPKHRKNKKKSARNLSQRHKSKKRHYPRSKAVYRKTDALDEYLHLTASAVKINYPTVNATSKELIEMVKSLPFYQAHDHLNRYMMDRLRWEQIQQNKLLQLKAAAIQSQRDHQMAQQSTVTRLFKKWFTTEYDDIHHIVANPRKNNKGRIDLSSPLSKKENLRLNRVGKAKMKQTESGGTSVNLGSLNPKGIPPKGTSKKKRIIHTSASRQKRGLRANMIDVDSTNRKRKKRDKKLKSLAMTQTLPTERMNDKKVQKMLQINAEYIDKVMQNEVQKKQKNAKAVTIKLTVPTKPSNEKISNAEVAPSHGNKSMQVQKNAQSQRAPQKQGWISWLTGAQQTQSANKERRRRDDIVRDPYALAVNGGGRKEKKMRHNKGRKHRKARKSRSPQTKQKEKRSAVDVNENIKNVIAVAQNENDDEAEEKMANLGPVHIESKSKEIGIKTNEIAEDEKEINLEPDAVNDDDVNDEKEHVVIGGDKSEPLIADITDTQTGKILEQKQIETDKASDEIAMDVVIDNSELGQVCEANMNELDADNANIKTLRNETDDVHNENGAVQSDEDAKSEHKIPDQKIECKSDDDIQLKSHGIMRDIDNMHDDDDKDGINAAMSPMPSTSPSPKTNDANPPQGIAEKTINIGDNEANDPYALSTDGVIESNLDDDSDDLDDILRPISPHRGAQVNVDHLQNNQHTHT